MIRDIYDMTECHTEVIARVFKGINYWVDTTLTNDNVDEFKNYDISCIVPVDGKLIIELA